MKLLVFGASGQLGSRLVTEALDRGHEVTAVARDASRLDDRGGRVSTASADATDADSVAAVAPGHDVVVSAVTQHHAPEMLVDAARGLLDGVARAGVRRLISVGGAGSLEVAPGMRLVDTPDFHDEWKPEALAGADALEVFRQADGDTPVEWTFVSPGALLAPGERTGRYRLGENRLLVGEDGRSHISMEDFAIAILDEVENPKHPRRRFTAAY
jgi:putative NADH-flavin reductase